MFPEFSSMLPKKQTTTPIIPLIERGKNSKKSAHHVFSFIKPYITYNSFLLLSLTLWFVVLLICFPTSAVTTKPNNLFPQDTFHNQTNVQNHDLVPANCDGGPYVYVYDLPAEFNVGLLEDCRHLSVYTYMCPHVANRGLGRQVSTIPTAANDAWFATHQFIAEMIFHARMENHPCRTRDPNLANLFYVPFYGGLHASSKFREPNITERDALPVRLINYLETQPTWRKNNGRDHFLALGRTAWDFTRNSNGPDFGANGLLNLNAVQNMSVLTVERNPWTGSNQYGIPYASYFHPSTSAEMATWQNQMRQSRRPHLFSFIGAPRKGLEKAAIRDDIIRQCEDMSSRCRLVNCGGKRGRECFDPAQVVRIMSESEFCLQAPGDSFTRRSTFDSILAGCIPVFFSPHTAYTQYLWYFPSNPTDYSVYIDEKGMGRKRIEAELLKIPRHKVKRMRDKVVSLIPRVTYKHPNATDFQFKDAVDVALAALSNHVSSPVAHISQ